MELLGRAPAAAEDERSAEAFPRYLKLQLTLQDDSATR